MRNDVYLPDLDSLHCFITAAEQRHFRAAARAVGLSPAAFSDRIKRLETNLGASLFSRTTRSVALTPAGHRLLPEARHCLEQARRCVEVVSEEGELPLELLIGTRFELGMSWLVPALSTLQAAHPNRQIHLDFGQSDDLLARLRDGRLDAFISSTRLTISGLTYATLHPEDYVFVAAPELVARVPMRGAVDAAAHRLLDTSPALPLFRYLLDGLGETEDWPFQGVESLGSIAPIRFRLLESAGVAVMPRYFVQEDIDAGRLVQLLSDAPMRTDAFRLIWRVNDHRDAALRALAGELRALPLR
jgi:LysR family glycine cleavage system transcriptional activator